MTTEEALAAAVVEPVNDIFEIDPETRVITVPASETKLPNPQAVSGYCIRCKTRRTVLYRMEQCKNGE